MHYRSRTYRIFSVFNIVFLLVLSAICIMPLIHILAVSFSAPAPANANLVRFWPVDFTVSAWEQTFGNQNFLRALWNGVFRTVLGTIISLVTITLAAYALSKEDREFKGRKMYMYALVFVMLFNGGLIPTYILVQNLGLINTIWALVLPGAVNVFNLILLLNFSEQACQSHWKRPLLLMGRATSKYYLKFICLSLCQHWRQLGCSPW